MKLPRWLYFMMFGLILLSPVIAVGLWWITWPERTAQQFVVLLGDARVAEARQMMKDPSTMKLTKGHGAKGEVDVMMFEGASNEPLICALPEYFAVARLKPLSMQDGELLNGRRRFELAGGIFGQMPAIEIVAERGKVHIRWMPNQVTVK